MWIVAVVYRFKYYFAWAVSECALIGSGFCFNGWDERGEAQWDRYCNTRIAKVELSTSAAELPAHWNTCTGNFLRRCEPTRPAPLHARSRQHTHSGALPVQGCAGAAADPGPESPVNEDPACVWVGLTAMLALPP